jgi:hypothetical protein
MGPHDLQPRGELAYGGGITAASLLFHYMNDYFTPIMTAIGALTGAIVGLHACWRILAHVRERKRHGRG